MKQFLLIALMLLEIQYLQASQPRKVLIIGVDGTRPDALQDANTSNIDGIIANSFFSYEAWHHGITISGSSWSSILTGVEYTKHGVTDNTYNNSKFYTYPYFTTRAKSCLPDLYCVQITQWVAMSDYVYNDGWNKKILVDDGAGDQTVAKTQEELKNPDLDVLFVYFDEVDLAGHASGFSRFNPEYIRAIETVDGHIGNIITALHNRVNYANEEWIILIVTDHGGIFKAMVDLHQVKEKSGG
jgi:predicted AlkP superfamily phosphohydrolase/phosphomutase